ncbi:MAG: protein phosphatase 2C domain-containing protein, partial [Cyanobacteria bacterium J06598_3]
MGDFLKGLTFAGLSDVGHHRATNQDSYYISPDGDLFIVADGMGGHIGGKEASRLATETIERYLSVHCQSDRTAPDLLEQAVLAANEAILADQRAHPERSDMGTTLVLILLRSEQFWCAHVGDSRLYRLRESGFTQLTEDHTWVAQAVASGELTPAQSMQHPWRHVLSQCVGREDLLKVEITPFEVESGDRLLLCSDGLTEDLSDDAI